MIPVELQDGLEARLKKLFSGFLIKNPNGVEGPLNIYKQHLPEKQDDQDDLSLYPYILIKLFSGEQLNEEDTQQVTVLFVVGVFDDGNLNQGYREVLTIMQKVENDLKRNPTVSNVFEMGFPFRWSLHEEDVEPFYFGGIETVWTTPSMNREDVEALI